MAEPRARGDAWGYVRLGLVVIATGVTTLGVEAASHTVEWVGRGAGGVLAVLIVCKRREPGPAGGRARLASGYCGGAQTA